MLMCSIIISLYFFIGAELKRKWTNIRDYYRKEIQKPKRIPTGSSAKKSKKYIYSDLLCFLTPVFANRKSEGNYSNEKIQIVLNHNDRQMKKKKVLNMISILQRCRYKLHR